MLRLYSVDGPYDEIAEKFFFLSFLSLFILTFLGTASCSVDFVSRILACRMTLKNLWLMTRMVRCPMGPVTRWQTQDRVLSFRMKGMQAELAFTILLQLIKVKA